MGVGLNTMLAAVGAGGVAASKVSSSFNSQQSDTQQIKSRLAEIKSNQGIVDEYTKERTNLLRVKPMLQKMNKWTEKHEKSVKYAEAMINKFSKANAELETLNKNTLSKGGNK